MDQVIHKNISNYSFIFFKVRVNDLNTCICSDGFLQINNKCVKCDPKCFKCIGKIYICIECAYGRFMLNGICECNAGTLK